MHVCMTASVNYLSFFRMLQASDCLPFVLMQVDEKLRSLIARRLVLECARTASTRFLESPPSSSPLDPQLLLNGSRPPSLQLFFYSSKPALSFETCVIIPFVYLAYIPQGKTHCNVFQVCLEQYQNDQYCYRLSAMKNIGISPEKPYQLSSTGITI